MTDSKESYESLLKDFLEELGVLVELTEKELEKLPEVNEYADILQQSIYYDSIKDDDPSEPRVADYKKFLDEWTDRDFHIFSDQSQIKYLATPGKLLGEIARVVYAAFDVLPHKFKVAIEAVFYLEEYNCIYATLVFIDEKLLEVNKS